VRKNIVTMTAQSGATQHQDVTDFGHINLVVVWVLGILRFACRPANGICLVVMKLLKDATTMCFSLVCRNNQKILQGIGAAAGRPFFICGLGIFCFARHDSGHDSIFVFSDRYRWQGPNGHNSHFAWGYSHACIHAGWHRCDGQGDVAGVGA